MTLIPNWQDVAAKAYSMWGLWGLIIVNAVMAGVTTYVENGGLTVTQLAIANIVVSAAVQIARLVKQPELSGE